MGSATVSTFVRIIAEPIFTFTPITIIMAKKQTLEVRIAAMIAAEAKKNTPKASAPAAPSQARIKAANVTKALALLNRAQDLQAQAMRLLNADSPEANRSDEFLANQAMFQEAPGAFFGRKSNGQPKAPSGKQATPANKEAFAKAYPSLVPGFTLDQDFVNNAKKGKAGKGGGGVKNG